jgi:hypothetical protein
VSGHCTSVLTGCAPAIERADTAHVTYWITITNLTGSQVQFEARYAIVA